MNRLPVLNRVINACPRKEISSLTVELGLTILAVVKTGLPSMRHGTYNGWSRRCLNGSIVGYMPVMHLAVLGKPLR